ncbi:MAG: hypothetical protein HYV04_17655 [Deltaproteobacteria bacterium]|nr:hypothetical protein [Deltaproteobacteria bacterium]
MPFEKHLYLILHPNEALVASQLTPEEFGRHYAVGSPRHFSGKVIFAEVDINFRHMYLDIDDLLAQTEKEGGRVPKRTKFISSYRVLERVELSKLKDLYLVTVDGKVLGIQGTREYPPEPPSKLGCVYQEIAPLHLLVASNLAPPEFGRFMTTEFKTKGAPILFFTQVELNVDDLLHSKKYDIVSPLPNVNLGHLKESIRELMDNPDKKTKTISLDSILPLLSYRNLHTGFWFAAGTDLIFYPLPSAAEMESKHDVWWRSA